VLQAHWSTNPVISDRFIGLDDNTVTLASVNVQKVDGKWVVVDAINLDDLEGVTSDGECKESICRGINDAEPVAESLLDVDPGPRGSWPTDETTFAVNGTTVRDWLVATTVIIAKELVVELDGGCMVPVCQDNDSVGVVNIIEAEVRIRWVVDNQSSTETVKHTGRKDESGTRNFVSGKASTNSLVDMTNPVGARLSVELSPELEVAG